MSPLIFSREFSMPSRDTFSIPPISRLLDRRLQNIKVVVDPFARNSKRATITNDLNPLTDATYHLEAVDFLRGLAGQGRAEVPQWRTCSPRFGARSRTQRT
jgi:hypothetical protein